MILPIVAYGDPVLKKVAEEIDSDYPGLDKLIEDMYETMYSSKGVGLAAPQINKSIRLFIIDASPFADEYPELEGWKKTFINPRILEEEGEEWDFNEGCLSIPGIREDVERKPELILEYEDENFELHEEKFDGIIARVIQHEYDHLEGILFTDHLSPLKKRLLKGKLTDISKGIVDVNYKMKFAKR
jgi:peptide deformylase